MSPEMLAEMYCEKKRGKNDKILDPLFFVFAALLASK